MDGVSQIRLDDHGYASQRSEIAATDLTVAAILRV
jgi:hypothetical protein